MDKLIELLENIVPGVDFSTCDTLIDDHKLSSFDVLTIVSEIEDEFDIELSPADLTPENFNSAQGIWNLIENNK